MIDEWDEEPGPLRERCSRPGSRCLVKFHLGMIHYDGRL
jgi:hypothetical protein